MYQPNYSKIAKKQDEVADMLAGNLVIRTQEIVESEFSGKQKKPKPLSYLKEAIEMCFWRGFYEGALDAEKEVDSPSKSKATANFSLSNLSSQILFSKKDDNEAELARIEARKKELDAFIAQNKAKGSIRSVIKKGSGDSTKSSLADQLKAAEAEKRALIKREAQILVPKKTRKAKAPVVRSGPQPRKVAARLTPVDGGAARGSYNYIDDGFDSQNQVSARGLDRQRRQRQLGNELKETENWYDWSKLGEDPYASLSDADRLKVTKNREMFVTLNTRYPSLFEEKSFFREYLDKRSTVLSENLKDEYEGRVKELIVNYSKNSGRSPDKVLKEIQGIINDKEESARLKQAIRVSVSKQQSLRLTNKEYLELYERNGGITQGRKAAPSLSKAEQKRLLKEQDDLFDNVIDSDTATAKEKQAARRRREEIDDILSASEKITNVNEYFVNGQPMTKAQIARYERLKNIAETNPDERRFLDKSRNAKFTKKELLVLRKTLGKELYTKYVNIGKEQDGLKNKDLVEIEKLLRAKGLAVSDQIAYKARTIAVTEVSAAYNLGRLQVYLNKGIRYVQFTATLDARTSVFCQSLHRKIYRLDELLVQSVARQAFPNTDEPEYSPSNRRYAARSGITFWQPPCHPNAYLPDTKVTSISPELLMRKRYEGKTVTIETEEGNHLSVTVEHPILTDRGFIRAGELKGGEYIFDTFLGERTVISNPDYNNSIPSVEELFELSRVFKSLVRGAVPIPTEDLDSSVSNNKVNVVNSAGNLLNDIFIPEGGENREELNFNAADSSLTLELTQSPSNTIFLSPLTASPSFISRSYSLPTLFGSKPCIEDLLSGRGVTQLLSRFSKDAFNNILIYTNSLTNSPSANADGVGIYNDVSEFLAKANCPTLSENVKVKRSKITNIVVKDYSGFVYHVQDASGVNVANGIIAHNCRSFLLPIYTDEDRKGREGFARIPGGAKRTSLALSPELDSVAINSIMERRLQEDLTDRELKSIMRMQKQARELQTETFSERVSLFGDLFQSGLKLLLRQMRNSQTEEEQKVMGTTLPDALKNDKKIVAALLGSAAVLGFGSMSYFFLKSNLGHSLKEYLAAKSADFLGRTVLAKLTTEQVGKAVKENLKGLQTLPEPMVMDLKSMGAQEPLNLPEMIRVGERLEESGDLALELALSGADFREMGITYEQVIKSTTRKRVLEYLPEYQRIMREALSNAAESVDPSNIKYIGIQDKSYLIVKKEGRNTFISKANFDRVVGDPKNKEFLGKMQDEIENQLDLLDRFDQTIDSDDMFSRSLLVTERNEMLKMRKLIANARTNVVTSPRKILLEDSDEFRELAENLRPQVQDLIEEAVNSEILYADLAQEVYNDFRRKLPSPTLLNSFVPETEEGLAFLKGVEREIANSLAEINKTYVKSKKPLTLVTASRNFSADAPGILKKNALEVEGKASSLNSRGITYEKNIPAINDRFRTDVETQYNELIDLKNRINNRIKELETNI